MKRMLSLLLAAALAWTLSVPALAQQAGELEGSIVILHTNDIHGAIGGYAKVAALKDAYEARGAYVLLLDAGDFIQGDPTVSASRGAAAVELMNLAGYDAAVPGNHEFDYGYDNLAALARKADFPVLGGNIRYPGETPFADQAIFQAPDGTLVGVFGLTTPETATKANPAKLQGVTFLSGSHLWDYAQAEVEDLRDQGCDYVICLGHLGIDEASAGSRSMDLLEHVDGIDVFIDGHSHSTQTDILLALGGTAFTAGGADVVVGSDMVNGAILTSAGTKLEEVGVVTINCESGFISTKTLSTDSLTGEDAAVAARAEAIQREIDEAYGAVFAKNEVALDGESQHVRTQETNLGDLIADALAWGAREAGVPVTAAITNGGGIRASIPAGDITKKDIQTVLPFGNTVSVVEVTGAELLEALEASTYCTTASLGGFPQVSGIEFTVDTAAAYDAGELYPGTTYHAPASIQRVEIASVWDEPFDPAATYTIATNDFVAAGGDTYHAFAAAGTCYDLGLAMDEVVMDYIADYLGGTVTYEAYAYPNSRIEIQGSLPFTDVSGDEPYYDAVRHCYENDIFKGVTETLFSPNGTMTRGQMVTVLWRMSGSPEPEQAAPFTDVAADSPFADAIAWGYVNGLVNGYTADTYQPGQAISTQQFLAILYRYGAMMGCDMSGGITLELYLDQDTISDYAWEAMEWAVGNGILVADKALRPGSAAMRFEVAEYLTAFDLRVAPSQTAA